MKTPKAASAGSVPKRVGHKIQPRKVGTQVNGRTCTICQGPVIKRDRRTCSPRCLAIARYRTKMWCLPGSRTNH